MKKYLLILVVLTIFTSCINSDCADYATGPPVTHVKLVDSDTGENIFTSGAYQYSDIKVVNLENENVKFDFISENDYNIIRFIPYTYSNSNTVFIKIKNEINVKLTFDIKKVKTECYTNFYIENLEVENYPFEIISNSGIVVIKV